MAISKRPRGDRTDRGRREDELVKVLVPQGDVPDDIVDDIVATVSETYGGSVTFVSEGAWVDRAGDLQTGEFAVVEIVTDADSQEV